ncbi:hypothetical protein DFH09DRAFT_1377180 [Mycena vulgaris]|nr:hypothetical protein DFH09DRAFT_1377180 [Mycena vulgaris]
MHPSFFRVWCGQREEAEEFLGFLLDPLEEELLPLPPAVTVEENRWLEVGRKNRAVVTRTVRSLPPPFSLIVRLTLAGGFRSTLRAAGQKDSVIIEAWRALRVDIQVRYTSLARSSSTSLQILFVALPPVLVLYVKLAKRVAFGPDLEIEGDPLAPTATTTGRKPGQYKLFAAVYHHGVSAAGGHYTLDVLPAAREWVRIDDEPVSDVRAETCLGSRASAKRGGNRVACWERHVVRLEARLEELEASLDVLNITSSRDNTSLESSDLTAICDVCGDEMDYGAGAVIPTKRRGVSPRMVVTVVALSARPAFR